MFTDLFPDSVTISSHTGATTDAEGTSTATYTTASYRGWLQQTDSVEVNTGRQVVTSRWLLFLPAEAVISESDRVTVDGDTFEVAGRPDRVKTPRGVHHLEVRLSLVDS